MGGGVCTSTKRLTGKTVVITGSSTGIGFETAKDLSARGARVVMGCRNRDKAEKAADRIREATKGDIKVYDLNLASLSSVRRCAREILAGESRIDILINNAGVATVANDNKKTEDGLEMRIGTNHFGHFLFTNLLLERIKACAPARIVTVSSSLHNRSRVHLDDINLERGGYSGITAYAQSKVANIHFTNELARRLQGTGVTTYSLHPGVVRTELGRDMNPVMRFITGCTIGHFLKSPAEGAQTSIYCAVDDACAKETGLYYADCKVKEPVSWAKDEQTDRALWELSEKVCGVKPKTIQVEEYHE